MNPALPPLLPTAVKRRQFLFFKIAGIGALIVGLHVPLELSRGVLKERQGYQAEATDAIAAVWGRQQVVTGPVLIVPYVYKTQAIRPKVVNGKVAQVEETVLSPATAYFLPEALAVDGDVIPEVRRRGIYETVVFSTKLNMTGYFQPDFVVAGIEAERIDWGKARLGLGMSDLHGVRSVALLKLSDADESSFEANDGVPEAFPLSAELAKVGAGIRRDFALEISLQGSERLEIVPVGKVTTAQLQSAWPDPSFIGASLPMRREIGAAGFDAEWQTSHFSRGFPQSWSDRVTEIGGMLSKMKASSFGVKFAQPVESYSMVERSLKYAVLFFVLIFTVFFLFETTAGLRIHPFQYALVGAALCLFFIAFLALSEFWPTGRAYGAAAAACTGMIALYAWSFLKTGWRTLIIGSGLAATYGYLYFVLKSQDYALLAGTAALFAVLALLMYFTRRINWFALDGTRRAQTAPEVKPAG
ncbi:MAG TPA: cell envelope integrity protein CreD [Opitutus sp.]|nr:cell envelope integrity protein CreD [Opitutus sp.]